MTRLAEGLQTRATPTGRAGGIVLLIAASLLWSISGVMLKFFQVPPTAFAFYRSIAAGLSMAVAIPLLGGRFPSPKWMALSVAIHAPMVYLFVQAMALGTAASGILLQYTAPVWVALLGWALQGRHVSRRTKLAMAVAAVGITIMIVGNWGGDRRAPVYGLLSGVAFGALVLVLDQIDRTADGRVNVAWVVLINNLGTAALLLPLVLKTGEIQLGGRVLAAVSLTGVVQMAMPYVLFQLALRRVTPVDASLLTLLEPVLNPLWVAMTTAEVPGWATVAGGGAILIAMVIEATKGEAPNEAN